MICIVHFKSGITACCLNQEKAFWIKEEDSRSEAFTNKIHLAFGGNEAEVDCFNKLMDEYATSKDILDAKTIFSASMQLALITGRSGESEAVLN